MIGRIVTDENGIPVDGNGQALTKASYQPPAELSLLYQRCYTDYGVAWQLQHRPFDEFDGVSLLERIRLDQRTFGAYVGMDFKKKGWRWKGRKNTARNKVIGILAHLITAVLIPTVFAIDGENKDDKLSAQAMRILIEEHLRKADYELKFMYMVLSALCQPAVFVQVEWVEQFRRVKRQLQNGTTEVLNAVDELLSGLQLNIVPCDEILLGDFFTFGIQRQPYLVRLRRISFDEARGKYAGKYFDTNAEGKVVDRFDYVRAGSTRTFLASQEGVTLYDVEWTEGDMNMVQEATFYYPGEDLQVSFAGGIFMGDYNKDDPESVYNINTFKHRRMTLVGEDWYSMPVLPFAMSGFEPLDPAMRFAYFKSAIHKEYWDDATLNFVHQILVDGMHLDVIKPLLISGIAKFDGTVMVPGAVGSLPQNASVVPYSIGPNLAAAMQVFQQQETDMQDSTIAKILEGNIGGGRISVMALNAMIQNAKVMLGVFGGMIADLTRQVGDLSIDSIVQNATVGQLDEELPGKLSMKYKTMLARSRDKGHDVTHKIVFTDKYIGKLMTTKEKDDREWELWKEAGSGKKGAMVIWEINAYAFARTRYSTYLDVDDIIQQSSGADKQRADIAFQRLMNPLVQPYVDTEAVVNDFVIEEYGGNDPDRYKRKGGSTPQLPPGAAAPGLSPNSPVGDMMGKGGAQVVGQGVDNSMFPGM